MNDRLNKGSESLSDAFQRADWLGGRWRTVLDDALATLFNTDALIQLGFLLLAILAAVFIGPRIRLAMSGLIPASGPTSLLHRGAQVLSVIATPLVLYLSLWIVTLSLDATGRSAAWLHAATSIMTAWFAVRLATVLIRSPFWSRLVFYIAWPLAVLDVFGLLQPLLDLFQRMAIPLGSDTSGAPLSVTMLDVLRSLLYFGVLFWGATVVNVFVQERVDASDDLNGAVKALLGKILNVAFPLVAFFIALQIVGFNLAALAVFSGAVGLGVGLGLQKIVSNYVAGFTLIADRSIKPGDVIEIDSTFGWVTSMQGRYVALRTRDGTELLIPNERFMTEGVVNWSRSDKVVRIHAPFGVSYRTRNLRRVQELAIAVAAGSPRVADFPKPVCQLVEFGDSSVNFDLRFWIQDPEGGLANVRSEILLRLWDMLHEEGIEFPFPQRDLHIRSWPEQPAPDLSPSAPDPDI